MSETVKNLVTEMTNEQLFAVWFLIGAALVFWMQAGFAMVEAGFTRAKNTGNIIMKNLMDFCIGTVTFILIGFGLLMGEDLVGFIGKPGFDLFTSYSNFNFSSFVFNLVFCATTATIVDGLPRFCRLLRDPHGRRYLRSYRRKDPRSTYR